MKQVVAVHYITLVIRLMLALMFIGSEQRAYGEEKSCETEPVEAKTEDKHSVLVDDSEFSFDSSS